MAAMQWGAAFPQLLCASQELRTQKCLTTTASNKLSWELLGLSTFKNLDICGYQIHLTDLTVNPNMQSLMQSLTEFPKTSWLRTEKNITICLDLKDFHQRISIYKKTSTLSKLVLHMVQYQQKANSKERVIFL